MSTKTTIPSVRVLPEDVVNKIAAGEVVERPASVVKELVENSLDARAARITVRLAAAGRRAIEVEDNGHGMSEHDALMAIERHATSKMRKAEDLERVATMGFRGEALASIAAVSRFELITRRAQDDHGTRIRIDGGTLRDVSQVAAPVGTRISANRLYFNTPVRAKFLKGMTTELSHALDVVQRHALAAEGVGFSLFHNNKPLLELPENARLRERIALIWGLNFVNDMEEVSGEQAGLRLRGLVGTPRLTRAQRSHQFFFVNGRPVTNRSLQYGFEDAYRGLLTIGRRPVGVVLIEAPPRVVDVNIHPTKREVRFRDERAARDAVRDVVRRALGELHGREGAFGQAQAPPESRYVTAQAPPSPVAQTPAGPLPRPPVCETDVVPDSGNGFAVTDSPIFEPVEPAPSPGAGTQTEFAGPVDEHDGQTDFAPGPFYESVQSLGDAPLQVFDTYLIVPEANRMLIIDQHALHERLTYDHLCADLEDQDYQAQQLAVPLLLDVPPSHARLLESNVDLFAKLGIEIEPFGGNTYQVTAICNTYDESAVPDAVCRVLDELAQGDLFDREDFLADMLRLTVSACRGAIKAGDRLSPEERRGLLDGFRRLRPPYTCPHGRPIITELTLSQMEKSFRRRQ